MFLTGNSINVLKKTFAYPSALKLQICFGSVEIFFFLALGNDDFSAQRKPSERLAKHWLTSFRVNVSSESQFPLE